MDERIDNYSPQPGASNQQLVIITQLLQAVTTFRHIDELFLWLARTIIQRFDVQVTEFWTMQVNATGQAATELRAIACQDTSLPRHVVGNNRVSAMAEHILREQRHSTLVAVASIFPTHQANLLSRYGLNYCCGYFLGTQPADYDLSSERTSPWSTASSLLFLRHTLPQNLLASIGLILEQTIPIAKNRGILVTAQLPAISSPPQPERDLLELIPRRSQNAELMRSSNPLASSVDIADKQARRLYAAIDGRKNLGELSSITGLNAKEIYAAVQILLTQQRIEL